MILRLRCGFCLATLFVPSVALAQPASPNLNTKDTATTSTLSPPPSGAAPAETSPVATTTPDHPPQELLGETKSNQPTGPSPALTTNDANRSQPKNREGVDRASPIPPERTTREIALYVPVKLEANTTGQAAAKIGIGLLRELTDPRAAAGGNWGWGMSVVASGQVDTANGASTLLGFSTKDDSTTSPTGSIGLSVGFLGLDSSSSGKGTPYVPFAAYVGGDLGRATYSYLMSDSANSTSFQVAKDKPRNSGSIGTMGYRLWPQLPYAPTIEWAAAYVVENKAAPKKAKWCSTVGTVTSSNANSDAQSCDESTIGPPSTTKTLSLGAHVGFIDTNEGHHPWRVALGAQLGIPTKSADIDYSLAINAPIYLSLGSQASDKSLSAFSGIIRLMPACIVVQPKEGKSNLTALVSIQFLGQRSLFTDTYNSKL